MADSSHIFRKTALDRLSSPEELDQLMQVTTSKSWLALVACCLLVVVAVVWGIWGSVRINVYGRGILIKHGGVYVATATGEGRVAQLLVREEESVTNQQILARLRVPELEMKIYQGVLLQSNLESELRELKEYQEKERSEEGLYQESAVRTYQAISNDCQVQVSALEDRLKGLAELYEGRSGMTGVVSKTTLLGVSNELFTAKHDLALTGVQIKQVQISRLQSEQRRHQLWLEKQALVTQGKRNLEFLTNLYDLTAEIRSPFVGTVLEITVKTNQLVNAHSPIMSLQSAEEKLEAWLFLAPGDGKRVQTNMPVRVAPVSVKKEAFGMMVGHVASVSTLPATPQLMLRVLENPTLVSEFTREGAPIYAVVDLATATNVSGFQWTSRQGPQLRITSGTLCEGVIALTNASPISFVLPLIRYSSVL